MHYPPRYLSGEEIKGIASATGIEPSVILIYNMFYTVFGACTSIVAESEAEHVYHVRNLDFGLWPSFNFSKGELCTPMQPLIVCTIPPSSCAPSTPHRVHYPPHIVCTIHPSSCALSTPHCVHHAPPIVCTTCALSTPRASVYLRAAEVAADAAAAEQQMLSSQASQAAAHNVGWIVHTMWGG